MNAYYIEIHDKENDCLNTKFPSNLIDYFQNKIKSVPSSVIFFNLYDKENSLNLELDLDKSREK